MAFNGYLVQFGNYKLPMKHILWAGYKGTYNGQDLDTTRNGAGDLIRNALDNAIPKAEVTFLPGLSNSVVDDIMTNIRSNYSNSVERCAITSIYIPELNDYVKQKCYMPDPDFTIRKIDLSRNIIKYEGFTLKFIGYGKNA